MLAVLITFLIDREGLSLRDRMAVEKPMGSRSRAVRASAARFLAMPRSTWLSDRHIATGAWKRPTCSP